MPELREADFAALFNAHFDSLLAYTRRRTPQLADAEDAMAETYIVAWRRMTEVPGDAQEQRLWLFGVAYRVIANQRRAAGRRLQLTDRLKAALLPPSRPSGALEDVTEALATLSDADQEILRLAAWEGLSHGEIGQVLGITPNAAAIRLHRARKRLEDAMKGSASTRTFKRWRGSVSSTESGEESQ
jgi:RNA polymerase sigma-70 factor (ECF subfamily)